MDKSVNAWILEVEKEQYIAVAENQMLAFITEPELYQVPFSPAGCSTLLRWQNRLIPLFNFFEINRDDCVQKVEKIGVLVYRESVQSSLTLLAVVLSDIPAHIQVNRKSKNADWNELSSLWKKMAISVFEFDRKFIPVINVALLAEGDFLKK